MDELTPSQSSRVNPPTLTPAQVQANQEAQDAASRQAAIGEQAASAAERQRRAEERNRAKADRDGKLKTAQDAKAKADAAKAQADADVANAEADLAQVPKEPHDADTEIGLQGLDGSVTYLAHPNGHLVTARPDGSYGHRDVSVRIGTQTYEHVDTDADGVWIYR